MILKIMILDDHIAIGEGTRAILDNELECFTEVYTDAYTALQHLANTKYDVYLIDFNLSDMDGLQFLEQLRKIDSIGKAIIYTGYNIEKYLPDLLKMGISGFISKTDSRKQLIDTIHYALEGKIILSITTLNRVFDNTPIHSFNQLTEREIQILSMVKNGLTNKAIANHLQLSQRTIEKDLTAIFSKLNVGSRAEAVFKWYELFPQSIEVLN